MCHVIQTRIYIKQNFLEILLNLTDCIWFKKIAEFSPLFKQKEMLFFFSHFTAQNIILLGTCTVLTGKLPQIAGLN